MCPFCDYIADRDMNAAKSILQAGVPPSGAADDRQVSELRNL